MTDQFNDPDALQPFDCALRGGEGDPQLASRKFGSDERIRPQKPDYTQWSVRRIGCDFALPLRKHFADANSATQRILGHSGHAEEEVFQPIVPRSTFADSSQAFIVFTPRRFKERGQVEQWRRQNLAFDQEQRYQQTSNSTVAIQKRMNSLELVVSQSNRD
jgi:hypothetical protein